MSTENNVSRKLSAIISADVKGYSLLMADNELHTIQTLKAFRKIISNLISEHSGRVVDSPGDNILAEFKSAVEAVQCAVKIQRKLDQENSKFIDAERVLFRIGVNIGDVIQDGDRIYGNGVNVAARIEGLAEPGGVCISRNAYDHIKGKLGLGYEYLGEHAVKNIKDPVRVYKVLMADEDAGKLIGDVPKPVAKSWIRATIVVAAVAITALASLVYQNILKPDFEPASIQKMAYPLPDKPSIAVLPFDNMSGDPDQEFFSDGITEEIISSLSRTNQLLVIARNSTFTYKGKPVKVNRVSEDLGVRYVLEGSVRKSENRVRITAQLIDATTGHHLWSERYDRDLSDIFALQDEITLKIVNSLRINLLEGEQARAWVRQHKNLDVLLKVMEANSLWDSGTNEGLVRYGQMGKEIVDMAPDAPNGYIILATYNWARAMRGESPSESIKKALEYAQKALVLDEYSSISLAILGQVYLLMRKYEKAIAAGEKSVELEPNGALAHVCLGQTLSYAGRPDEAIGHLKQGIRLDPFPPAWYFFHLGRCYRQKGQYEEALTAFEKALRLSPGDKFSHVCLASIYTLLNRNEMANAAAQKVLEIDPHFSIKTASTAWPYKNPADLMTFVDSLRKAGLPE